MSVPLVDLEKQLKAVTKTGKYVVGRKEVLNGLKGSKLVVWSASANVPPQILNECRSLQVPAIRFSGNPIELGKTCGIPYKVSVIAVKSPGDAVLTTFENSHDCSVLKSGLQMQQMVPTPGSVTKPEKKEEKLETKGRQKSARASKKEEKEEQPKSRKSDRGEEKEAVKERRKKAPKKKAKEQEEEEIVAQAEEDTEEEEED